ncbi:MAG: hypothetical protein QM610_00670 [Chitinophagaceae bacterium]
MKNTKMKFLIFFPLLVISVNEAVAQKEIILGSHAHKGHSNTTIAKGEGIGMKLKAGKKGVTIQSLNINLIEQHPDSVRFYVRIFPMDGKSLGNNIGPDKVFTASLKDNHIYVSLTDYHITVRGDFVVGVEWSANANGSVNTISFHTGVLKKGIYYKETDDPRWKKIPFFGFDIELRGIEDTL